MDFQYSDKVKDLRQQLLRRQLLQLSVCHLF